MQAGDGCNSTAIPIKIHGFISVHMPIGSWVVQALLLEAFRNLLVRRSNLNPIAANSQQKSAPALLDM